MNTKGKIKLPITEEAMVGIEMAFAIYIGAIVYLFTPVGVWLDNVKGSLRTLLILGYLIALFVFFVVFGTQVDKIFEYKAQKLWKPVFRKKLRINHGMVRLGFAILSLPILIPIIYWLDHWDELNNTVRLTATIMIYFAPIRSVAH